jgi:hypothetical protein
MIRLNNKKIVSLLTLYFLILLIVVCNLSNLVFNHNKIIAFAQNGGENDEINGEGGDTDEGGDNDEINGEGEKEDGSDTSDFFGNFNEKVNGEVNGEGGGDENVNYEDRNYKLVPDIGGTEKQLGEVSGDGGHQSTTQSQTETDTSKLSCPENQHRNNKGSCESGLIQNELVVIIKSSMGISKEVSIGIK